MKNDSLPHNLDVYQPKEEGLENTVGKGENAQRAYPYSHRIHFKTGIGLTAFED